MKIKFSGAAREVTGSKHLIYTEHGKTILLDCGMYQGKGLETDAMNRKLGFNPASIDYLILSHAHIDHSGLIPYIVKNGFNGTVYCTPATRDLCSIMLADSGNIQENDVKNFNKKREIQGLPPIEPIYTAADAAQAMELFVSIPYNKVFKIDEKVSVKFTDAGHILGSAAINLTITESHTIHKLCFTGDIGRPHNRILKSPQAFSQAEIIITESTYGDRLHEGMKDSEEKLLEVVKYTCVEKRGKLIIPSFSVGRTQEIIYALDILKNKNLLPNVKIYVDSPLSTNATNIMRLHPECFNQDMLNYLQTDPDPFGFNNLFYIQTKEDSKKLNKITEPCVIISASGMMEAGRVKHHLANSISNAKNTILVVGYCAPTTLGARIVRGDKTVSIYGKEYLVKADIRLLESFSAHGDYKEMINYLSCQDKNKLIKLFLVHGEYEVQQHYKSTLETNGFSRIAIPEFGEEFSF